MASDHELQSARLPSQARITELLAGDFERAGYEIEDVRIEEAARPPRIVVVADSDHRPELDSIAALSRSASELLDDLAGDFGEYVLEVTSPGVERPLTSAKHFRRAQGRKAELTLSDGSIVVGRIGANDGATLRLVLRQGGRGDWAVREIALTDISRAVVQVEFSSPGRRELELAGQCEKEAGT